MDVPTFDELFESFDVWWIELQKLAKDAEWNLGDKNSYKEFYDDSDSPEEALESDLENYEP